LPALASGFAERVPGAAARPARARIPAGGTLRGAPVRAPAAEAGTPIRKERSRQAGTQAEAGTPVLRRLGQTLRRIARARAAPAALLQRYFDGGAVLNGADASAVDAGKAPELPPYIKIANRDDARYLAEIHQAATRSRTGRKVLRQILEYTGNGREPVIFEFQGEDGGSFTSAWEVVRLSKAYREDSIDKAASAYIHELVHVLQKGKDLPFNGIELEIEAFIKQLKVARELGVKWGKDDFHYGLHRALKASVEGFVEYLIDSPGYEDSITLVGHDFSYAERQLRDMETASRRAIESSEDHYKEREQTLKLMRSLGYADFRVKAYRGDEVLATEEVIVSHESAIHLARRDQRILRTRTGRRRYLEFSREALKEARSFRALLNRTDQEGAARKKARLALPRESLVDSYEPLPEPATRKTPSRKPERYPVEAEPSPLTDVFRAANKDDERWLRALLDAVRESPTGRAYLEAVERRGRRDHRGGRPWVIEFYDGKLNQGNYYYGKWDLIQMNRRHQTRPPREYAPDFIQLLGDLLHEGRLVSYALETSVESYASAFQVIRELGLELPKSNPLYTAEKHFRKSFEHFLEWLQKSDPQAMLLEKRGLAGVKASIERRRRYYAKDLAEKRDYLRERRATYRLMRAEHINHQLQRFFRADEVVGSESEVLAAQSTLDIIDQDLRMLEKRTHARFYEKYARWATERARRIHAEYNATPPLPRN
jgi:hypothetical protein